MVFGDSEGLCVFWSLHPSSSFCSCLSSFLLLIWTSPAGLPLLVKKKMLETFGSQLPKTKGQCSRNCVYLSLCVRAHIQVCVLAQAWMCVCVQYVCACLSCRSISVVCNHICLHLYLLAHICGSNPINMIHSIFTFVTTLPAVHYCRANPL